MYVLEPMYNFVQISCFSSSRTEKQSSHSSVLKSGIGVIYFWVSHLNLSSTCPDNGDHCRSKITFQHNGGPHSTFSLLSLPESL
ncbi:hypothetical protein ACN38_g767 [Penicillium nordicum]|uniref:Uncharacterized protein n=1 Tax=Penicillium nordicum TaxID=229535 RepID=A0A0M8PA16_9EURO|nr:hypothetical protein ACN38_g767 [Penicillium nordicum]